MASSSAEFPSYSTKLYSKNVLVIGGSSGIGFAVASAAYDNGACVTISSSSQDKLAKAVDRIRTGYPTPPKSSSIASCVTDLADVEKLEDNLRSLLEEATQNGRRPLDHIAITAGDKLDIKPLTETSVSHIQKCSVVRFLAPILLSKLILQRNQDASSDSNESTSRNAYLLPSPDSSLTLTSGSNVDKPAAGGWTIVAGYGAAVEGASRSLAKELKPIRVNVVSPGAVETELFSSIPEDRKEKVMKSFRDETLTGRVGRPQDLAESYLYCMRDGFLTGKIIGSDGGRLLN